MNLPFCAFRGFRGYKKRGTTGNKREEKRMDIDSKHGKPSNLWRLLRYVQPYWLQFAGATFFGIIKFLTPVAVAWVIGEAINVLRAADKDTMSPEVAWARLGQLLLLGAGIAVFSFFPTYLRSMVGARAVQQVVQDLRCDLYAHIQKLSHSFFDANRSGSLTSRIIGDVETIQPFLNQGLIQGWMNIGVIVTVLLYFFSQNVYLALLSLAVIPFHILVQRSISWRVKANVRKIRDQLAWLSGSTQEKLAGATIVKAFTREDDEVQRFSEDSAQLIGMGIRNAQLNGLSQSFVIVLNSLAPLLVIYFGGRTGLFHPGAISIGLLVQFILMQNHIYGPFERLNEMQLITANALGATDRIFDIFDTEPEVADRPKALKAPHFTGKIDFQQVCFSYPGATRQTLSGLSLEVPARTTLALVGPSGGGKTTVTNLLNRFYEWEAGSISIDGRDIRDYTIFSLRNQMALVPQDALLFSGTIAENISYGRPGATTEEIEEAARKAYATDFIEQMDDGYDTMLGERGARLSGGQRQRIAIARAFIKDPAILILDEATSALDSESEQIVQLALEELMKNRTTLVIAHRLSTIRNASQIAVIARGKVAECGTHEELIASNGLYARLHRRQMSRGVG